jgi:predicted dehydrogenase
MIGCGGRNAGAAVQALTADPGTRLVAMCDIFLDRVHEKRALIQNQRPDQVSVLDDHCFTGFDSYKKVIEASDVVLVANAAKFHPLHLKAAIEAGKHVFVEKPHAIDPAGIKVVKAACELAKQRNLSVLSGLHSRHHAGYLETIQRIHDGAIGEVVALEENFLRSPYGIIGRKPGLTELHYQYSTQYHFNWLSGDDVVQSLVHNLDRSTWVMRGQSPVKCHGLGGRSTMTDPVPKLSNLVRVDPPCVGIEPVRRHGAGRIDEALAGAPMHPVVVAVPVGIDGKVALFPKRLADGRLAGS